MQESKGVEKRELLWKKLSVASLHTASTIADCLTFDMFTELTSQYWPQEHVRRRVYRQFIWFWTIKLALARASTKERIDYPKERYDNHISGPSVVEKALERITTETHIFQKLCGDSGIQYSPIQTFYPIPRTERLENYAYLFRRLLFMTPDLPLEVWSDDYDPGAPAQAQVPMCAQTQVEPVCKASVQVPPERVQPEQAIGENRLVSIVFALRAENDSVRFAAESIFGDRVTIGEAASVMSVRLRIANVLKDTEMLIPKTLDTAKTIKELGLRDKDAIDFYASNVPPEQIVAQPVCKTMAQVPMYAQTQGELVCSVERGAPPTFGGNRFVNITFRLEPICSLAQACLDSNTIGETAKVMTERFRRVGALEDYETLIPKTLDPVKTIKELGLRDNDVIDFYASKFPPEQPPRLVNITFRVLAKDQSIRFALSSFFPENMYIGDALDEVCAKLKDARVMEPDEKIRCLTKYEPVLTIKQLGLRDYDYVIVYMA